MKELTLRKIAEACHGTVAPEAETVTVTGVQSDSRRVRPGDLFVAIKGEKADGHDFVAMAASLGAKAALVARPVEAPIPTILVADTIRAYGDLAAAYREHAGITVIGITGSVGKTTTKEMTACLLARSFHTARTEGNHNNNLGLPMTILDMPDDTEVAVLEMGMNHFGEMAYLTSIARPDIAIITNIGTMHIEHLGSREGILQANPDHVVIVDEAYVDFGGESCVPLIDRYENLLVVQTFSKSRQLAGARLGLAMGNAKLIADLNRVKFSLNPYNINRLTLKAGQAALEDTAYFDTTRAAIVETRSWTRQQLEARGFTVLDSRSNFLFVRTARQDGGTLYRKLKENGVLVRHFDAPRIHSWLRITIGTPAQMQALLAALDKILED